MKLRRQKPAGETPSMGLSLHSTLAYNSALNAGGWLSRERFHQLTNGSELVKAELKIKGLIIETVGGDILARQESRAA